VPDLSESLPGRGFWVSAQRSAIEALVRRKARGPSKARLSCEAGMSDRIEALLAGRCMALIGFARRAGHAVVGRERVSAAADRGALALVLQARGAVTTGNETAPAGRFALLDTAELGRAWGRDDASLIGILPGRIAQSLARELHRLAGFRAGSRPLLPERRDGATA
jgi:hypothetical protein